MSLDHLYEEGQAEPEQIEIPLSIILFFPILLVISYKINFKGHFHVFGLLARILFRIYEFWTKSRMRCFTDTFFCILTMI